jgi:nucleotide-binding universal stress UspA family protein
VTGGITGGAGGGVADASRPDVPLYAETKDQAIQQKVAELKDYLESKAAGLRNSGYQVTTVAEVGDSPAHAIAEHAKVTKPTFIAMVRTTHRSLADRVFGTVAQQVIRSDVAPVMILPSQ